MVTLAYHKPPYTNCLQMQQEEGRDENSKETQRHAEVCNFKESSSKEQQQKNNNNNKTSSTKNQKEK